MAAGRSALSPLCVDTEQIFDDSITQPKIGPAAVGTTELANDAVTADKVVAGMLTNGTRQCLAYAEVSCIADATVPIGTIPGGSMVTDIIVATSTAINSNGTQNIGDAGAIDGLLATANITKTLDAISGEDPATRGVYLWVPGVQEGTPGFAVTTYGHARKKWYANDTIINATIAKGSSTTGVIRVYVFYERGVMAD